ncbi:MAG TPA: geranylgeranylglycerol-phosphate geranylgeranyltransferase [Flavisolibacter sp.]|jgi:4-hydroxybenzoate polyprenyltransferase|nr:geranylgeranylglycerol-phosphate geranylgeranyltransferase [Flavisolibacter sp.]
MKLIAAFLRLVRWPNLVFIILTQMLFYYCVYEQLFHINNIWTLAWVIVASVLIAAGGYIINDYFDLNIDQINKPEKNVFVRIVHRRWAIIWHFSFSLLGIIATAIGVGFHKWYLTLANIACTVLLWFYSTSFKRKFLIGNVVISILTAWTVLILFFVFTSPRDAIVGNSAATIKFFRVSFLYAGFAFISSLIREAIKDMEDLEGDARYGCRTLPIVAGIRSTKIYVGIWTVVLLAALIILQLYVLQFQWWYAIAYSFLFVIIPLAYLLYKLPKATTVTDFGRLSNLSKLIMFTGIVSMIFFRIYF